MSTLSLSTPQSSTDTMRVLNPTSSKSIALSGAKNIPPEKVRAVAEEFEAQFVAQMLESMFATRDVKESLGGSEAEETYQSMMVTEYGKAIVRSGGLGIADQIQREMLKMQEMEKPNA